MVKKYLTFQLKWLAENIFKYLYKSNTNFSFSYGYCIFHGLTLVIWSASGLTAGATFRSSFTCSRTSSGMFSRVLELKRLSCGSNSSMYTMKSENPAGNYFQSITGLYFVLLMVSLPTCLISLPSCSQSSSVSQKPTRFRSHSCFFHFPL